MPRKKTSPRAKSPAPSGKAATRPSENRFEKETRLEQISSAVDERQKAQSSLSMLLTAAKDPNFVLHRPIVAVGMLNESEENAEACWIVASDCQVSIRIPFSEAFDSDPMAGNPPASRSERLRRQQTILSKSIGVEIAFTVKQVNREDYSMIATRKTPNELLRRTYFGENSPKKLQAGMDVRATIIACGVHSLFINVCGVDMTIREHMLSWRYNNDLTAVPEYKAGNKLILRVKKVEIPAEGLPRLVLSGRDAEVEKCKNTNITFPANGMICAGTVTSFSGLHTPNVRIFLWLDDLNMPAQASDCVIEGLTSGSRVMYRAIGKTNTGMIHGRIFRKI